MSRTDGQLLDGVAAPVRHEVRGANGGPTDASTVALICQGGGQDSWLLTICADTGVGMSMLGRIRTLPWKMGRRTVAICAMPGARAWEVTGRRIAPTSDWRVGEVTIPGDPRFLSDNARLAIWMTSTRQIGGEWGVKPIRGFAEVAKTAFSASGVDGAFTIRGNITGWTAFNANAPDGSVIVNNQPARIIPGGGGILQGGPIPYLGYGNFFHFIGTSAYTVEYEIEDPTEGAGA